MRIQILFYADPTFHPDAEPEHSFQKKAQTLEKVLKYANILHIWLVICKLMQIRILIFIWCGSGFLFDADPGFQTDADPRGCDPEADPDPQHWM